MHPPLQARSQVTEQCTHGRATNIFLLPVPNQGCQHCYEPLGLLKLACTPDWRYDGALIALCCELLTGSVRTIPAIALRS